MTKTKKSAFALTMVAATLCGCSFGNKDVTFWTPFGALYQNILNGIVTDAQNELGISIKCESKGSYPNVKDAVVSAISSSKYPGLVVGYPDHFAQYHGLKALVPLDDLVPSEMLAEFPEQYMKENYLYETDGTKHLYGLPFNKSTEILGYNRVFVEYCADKYSDPELKTIPATWNEWGDTANPTSKVARYMETFDDLVGNKKSLYAVLSEDGHASNFSTSPTGASGEVKVLDYSSAGGKSNYRLFSWDSADNAFITLAKQWGATYTELPASEYTKSPLRRKGSVLFANSDNLPKTLEMLKFFKRLHSERIFATPADLGNAQYSSEPFKSGMCMFFVCSTGGQAHNTGMWKQRFSSAPIPYNVIKEEGQPDKEMKLVISQGANICMTKKANQEKAFKVIKALTTGKYQCKWALDTGYFPASSSAENEKDYQDFLSSTVTGEAHELEVYQRESSKTIAEHYSNASKGWVRFVDDAYIGSSEVRTLVGTILPRIFNVIGDDKLTDDDAYYAELKDILNEPTFVRHTNLNVELDSKVK